MFRHFLSFALVWDVARTSEGTQQDIELVMLLQKQNKFSLVDKFVDFTNDGAVIPQKALDFWERRGISAPALLQRAQKRSIGSSRAVLERYVARKGGGGKRVDIKAPICNYYLHTKRGTPGMASSDCDYLNSYEKLRLEAKKQLQKVIEKYKEFNEHLVSMGAANLIRLNPPEIPNMWKEMNDVWDAVPGIEEPCRSESWNDDTWEDSWGPFRLCADEKLPSCEDELMAIFEHEGHVDASVGCAVHLTEAEKRDGNVYKTMQDKGFEIFPGSSALWRCQTEAQERQKTPDSLIRDACNDLR